MIEKVFILDLPKDDLRPKPKGASVEKEPHEKSKVA